MSNEFSLYLVTRVDDLRLALNFFQVASFFVAAGCLAAFVPFAIEDEDESWRKNILPIARKSAVVFGLSLTASILIPTKSDLFFIYGGSAILEAAKTDRAVNIGNKTLDAVESWIDSVTKKDDVK